MMPIPSIEDSPANEGATGEAAKKPKTLPCRYCQKRFRRLEHVQRHERTHTKEKPFRCSCGKNFGRRDLLVRHEKLVHFNEANKDGQPAPGGMIPQTPAPLQTSPAYTAQTPAFSAPTPSLIDPDLLQPGSFSGQMANPMPTLSAKSPESYRTPGCSLDLLSDAANHLATSGHHLPSMMQEPLSDGRGGMMMNGGHTGMQYDTRMDQDTPMRNSGYQAMGPSGGLEDYNLFLDDFGLSSHYFLPMYDTEMPSSFWSRPPLLSQESAGQAETKPQLLHDGQEAHNSFSRFGSRLPSLQPEVRDGSDNHQLPEEITRTGPPWKISPQDHRQIRSKLDDFTNVLPKGFTLPSRHTLSRFWEGYINGFHEHLPFLHLPTISAVHSSPELILAIAAVGAQYRFEGHRGNALWYASKAIAMEQIRRRSSQQVAEILSPPSTYRSTSAVPSPSISTTMNRTGDMSSEDVKPGAGSRGQSESLADDSLQVSTAFMSSVYPELTTVFDHSVDTPQARMETIQALLLLMAMGTWGPRALLREGLCLRSHVSLLAREMGLNDTQPTPEDISWHDWIQVEAERRTKLIVYCFFGLQCIAYDMPPLLLNAEINLLLPCSAKEWKAENCRAWKEARRSSPHPEVSFPDALAKLFARGGPPGHANIAPVSSMGNYILIHALVQQIFFVRQTSTTSNPGTANNSLRPEDIDELGSALRSWQAGWERTPESSLDPSNPNGPVAFNSTALLRLAYIRLHSDLGPCRRLDTRDPIRIAAAFKNSPPLVRSARLGRAVLQSAHALSIPVRIGIAFVARTQTFSWSIQHSLCNLECAFLLSKWLETIAASPLDLTQDERNILEMVRSMLEETEFAVSNMESSYPPPSTSDPAAAAADETSRSIELERIKIKQLGTAVVRLWAETFKGTHIFEIVKLIGSSLEIYAQLLEKEQRGDGMGGGGAGGGGQS